MSSRKSRYVQLKPILLFFLLLMILIQLTTIGSASVTRDIRQIGKSDVTLITSDVYGAGLDVPEEYSNEVAMIKFSDDEPIEGETVIINATVFNIGTRSASVTVYFYDGEPANGDLIGIDTLEISPLGHQYASTPWDTTGEGEYHTIFVLLNPDDPANETNDDNNQATRDIIVNQIPFASAGSNLAGNEDDEFIFDGTGSSDTASDLSVGLIYTWDFNDPFADAENPGVVSGNNLTKPSHIFTNEGVYIVNLTVEDDGGATATDSLRVTVRNVKPDAKAKVTKTTVDEDEGLTFDAVDSTDTTSDMPLLKYYWDFGDGMNSGWINDTSISYSYTKKNSYTVTLIVKDDNNVTDSETLGIVVNNVAPTADAGSNLEVIDSTVVFNASGSKDTHSDQKSLKYDWDFGDGYYGEGLEVTHTFNSKGVYTVILTVTDDDGATSQDSISVTINNLSPISVITLEKEVAEEDEEVLFNGSNSYDPDGSILKYRWDFGDGITGFGMTTSHTYTDAGSYLISLIVEDNNNVLNRNTRLITIENVLPVADAGENAEVYINEDAIFNAGNSSDTPSDIDFLQYLWDFGDNTTGEGIITNHSYERAGVYEVILTVIDDDGAEAFSTIRIYVRDILLSSITITETLEPSRCQPKDTFIVSGKVEFNFIDKLPDTDIVLSKLRIEIVETGEAWTVIPEFDGSYELELIAPEIEGTYNVRVSITRLGIFAESSETLTVESYEIAEKSDKAYIDFNTAVIVTAICAVTGGLGAFAAGTDLGRYKFFTLFIPLYSRLNPKAILDNFTRGRIYEHIRMNPGEHYRGIKDTLELNNGSLSYHLKVLENENLIQSRTDGMCKRFYPVGMKIEKGQPSNIQQLILEKICESPYITQKDLAEQIGIDISTVNYHINIMAGSGIIQSEKSGKTKHYYASPEYDQITVKSS
ncbi:MAG: PKD domain-containing protein [Thermoplasmata archaeon]|nr:MAG: PKD domain-containing protein [Thermoplasmata archaeon]